MAMMIQFWCNIFGPVSNSLNALRNTSGEAALKYDLFKAHTHTHSPILELANLPTLRLNYLHKHYDSLLLVSPSVIRSENVAKYLLRKRNGSVNITLKLFSNGTILNGDDERESVVYESFCAKLTNNTQP